ncbi:MAG: NAD-dependent epimerase/dehydratase family protein [Planctomycetota bacterium]
MHVALIGGTRFIGPAVAEALLARGHRVSALHRGLHPSPVEDMASVPCERSDAAALAATLADLAPDAAVDTRAMTEGDARVASAALGSTPSVVLSSQDVYAQFGRIKGLDAPPPEPELYEDSPLGAPFAYRGLPGYEDLPDYDKKRVEAVYVRDGALFERPTAILRLPAVYGPRDPQRRFGALLDALDAGEPVPCEGEAGWRWSHSHVDNVAHAVALAVEAMRPGCHLYNVSEPEAWSMREWAERIAEVAGRELRWAETEGLDSEWALFGRWRNDLVVRSARIRSTLRFEEVLDAEARVRDLVDCLRATRDAA